MPTLRGMTWKHDRGLAPMLATASAFGKEHPEVVIQWEARSLREFGDASVQALADRYDLVVIDHPFMGEVARQGCFLPLDEYISKAQLRDLEAESVGRSQQNYCFEGHHWALAIDAAAQVAGCRTDLLDRVGVGIPTTWREVFELARIRRGFVSLALSPIDALICFFTLCANSGAPPFTACRNKVVPDDIGEYALECLQRFAQRSIEGALSANPIAVWERMSSTDDIAYCPLAFGYSNYSRKGYRPSLISFGPIPSSKSSEPVGATLGGAGLAISKKCEHIELAVDYALWVASPECQRSLYHESGGQPSSRTAWLDEAANRITNSFFTATLPVIENAWIRPRYAGFVEFQNAAAEVIGRFLKNDLPSLGTLRSLNELYRHSLCDKPATPGVTT